MVLVCRAGARDSWHRSTKLISRRATNTGKGRAESLTRPDLATALKAASLSLKAASHATGALKVPCDGSQVWDQGFLGNTRHVPLERKRAHGEPPTTPQSRMRRWAVAELGTLGARSGQIGTETHTSPSRLIDGELHEKRAARCEEPPTRDTSMSRPGPKSVPKPSDTDAVSGFTNAVDTAGDHP